MNILYIGTVCNLDKYEKFLDGCEDIPSRASIVFENALLNGFKDNNAKVSVISYPMVPTFPKSRHLLWGNKIEVLESGYYCTWIKTLNIPFIKQITRRKDGKRLIMQWLEKNKNDECAILSYSIPPFLAKDILKCGEKFNVPCYAIVPDLLQDMYKNHKANSIVNKLRNSYLKSAVKVQGEFKGYVFLTEAMSKVINPDKPYIVIEALADVEKHNCDSDNNCVLKDNKDANLSIMYAGGLHEKYGILNLLDAYELIEVPNVELWLFGNGSAVNTIIERSRHNSRIKYFGSVTREEILEYEKKATLLVNVRNENDEYTKYSFPSKIIEYMLSGTPVLSTVLPGIPKEYFQYIIPIEDNAIDTISKKINEVLLIPKEEKELLGKKAQQFIVTRKNSSVQVDKLLKFIKNYRN